ncbi:MAG: NAD(P)/FAD-dependent oxidoreductase [Bacteroidota bacterium]|nr:NAD(P)/FAD-dependent oxidoreductase [Bacteroidota bacterium]
MTAIPDLFPATSKKRIVIIGGGFGGIRLVKKLRNKGFQIILLDRNNYHTFQPLLYQVASGGLEPDSIAYPLRKIFQGYPDFFFRMAAVKSIDAVTKTVHTNIGAITYDDLVIAAGSTNNFFGMNTLAENAMPLKTVTDALDLRSLLLQNMERSLSAGSEKQKYQNIVIAGGGPTGVETAGALCELKKHVLPHDYPELNFKEMKIILAESGPALLAGFSPFASQKALESLQKIGVDIRLNTAVKDFDGQEVLLADGSRIPCNAFIWSAGVKGVDMKGVTVASITKGNRIAVDRFNKVLEMEHVYAIGDIALMKEDKYPNGHPMVAQVAIQQAQNLAYNLVARNKSATLKPFSYKNLGSLATIGRNKAVADFSFMKLHGFVAWVLWLIVHLMTLVGFRNRVIVLINWVWYYFSYDRAIRLIIRPFNKEDR